MDRSPNPDRETSNEPGETVEIDGELFLRLAAVDLMDPFLMTIVGDTDFWLFVGSNGGFTAGRVDADHALFPYRTADKILRQPEASGAMTLVDCDGEIWQPFGGGCIKPSTVSRCLYKHHTGCAVCFEETHHQLGLRFSMLLTPCDDYGLVRECRLENLRPQVRNFRLLDGWHGIQPPGVSEETYSKYSYLAAAYMHHELPGDAGIGLYTLNCGITDRAEPYESLRISVAWSAGHQAPRISLTDRCVRQFPAGVRLDLPLEVRGEPGAFLVLDDHLSLEAGSQHRWFTVADIGLDHAALASLKARINGMTDRMAALSEVLPNAARRIRRRIAGAGAIQHTADKTACFHHFANVLFNSMRGGVPQNGYRIDRKDFLRFLQSRSIDVAAKHREWVLGLPEDAALGGLPAAAAERQCPQLLRLASEYLPLSFSRRHGDPSRPWNRFSIRLRDAAGEPVCRYSGNWRDIFQNWESLAHSYPAFAAPMISVFLNASTADGYNPYRISNEGIEWELEDPKDPWSHIGYWGDHQIVYLHRLLRVHDEYWPGTLVGALDERLHVYSLVPYEIRSFDRLIEDPRNSIRFNSALHDQLVAQAALRGNDAKLIHGDDGSPLLVTLAEKLLVPLLVKLTNFVPNGGIWLNTQRPEWNDGNNALAGWGLSVVTVCHLHAYAEWLSGLFSGCRSDHFTLSAPVARLLEEVSAALEEIPAEVDDDSRFVVMERLGRAGERHREAIYRRAPMSGVGVRLHAVLRMLGLALESAISTMQANRRDDGLFHSYNVLEISHGRAAIHRLQCMLEGQVAALASGLLDGNAALALLTSLRHSDLYRADQHSYLLQPDRVIEPFEARNRLPEDWETRVPHIALTAKSGASALICCEPSGPAHFAADLTNERCLRQALHTQIRNAELPAEAAVEEAGLIELWETVFHHRSFIGRSGAMFAFEGLGSIYWHMVAKLLLAVQETYERERRNHPESSAVHALAASYEDIRAGLGVAKSPETYGAFPTDPYSHSPRHSGAQQPGMTGQVKEEILTRMGELGVHIRSGRIHFEPTLLKACEFFESPSLFRFPDADARGNIREIPLPAGALAFILMDVPVVYQNADDASIRLSFKDGMESRIDGSILPADLSHSLFHRTARIARIEVSIPKKPFS